MCGVLSLVTCGVAVVTGQGIGRQGVAATVMFACFEKTSAGAVVDATYAMHSERLLVIMR
jgi:hypothetical protein